MGNDPAKLDPYSFWSKVAGWAVLILFGIEMIGPRWWPSPVPWWIDVALTVSTIALGTLMFLSMLHKRKRN